MLVCLSIICLEGNHKKQKLMTVSKEGLTSAQHEAAMWQLLFHGPLGSPPTNSVGCIATWVAVKADDASGLDHVTKLAGKEPEMVQEVEQNQ